MSPKVTETPEALPPQNTPAAAERARPRMVLAHGEPAQAGLISRHFRRLGWEVHVAPSGPQARQLTLQLAPVAVVLHTDLPGESGWLTCDKLLRQSPGQKVILLTPLPAHERGAFAAFVGAAGLVGAADGIHALVDEVYGPALAAAG